MSSAKKRLDEVLVSRGLVETRAKARALIMAGEVLVSETPAQKAGFLVADDAVIRVRTASKFVSRGGEKLAAALSRFSVDVSDSVCLDIGASTGGFTDCLLQRGAKKIYAIDVGYGQMHWKLQSDVRVIRMDRVNFRLIEVKSFPELVDVAVMDASFVSAALLIPNLSALLKVNGMAIILVKPQFEVGKGAVGKGGIVRDEAKRLATVFSIRRTLEVNQLEVLGEMESPLRGGDGNVEYLLVGKKIGP